MDIPLELERRCERRWAARFSSRIVLARYQPRRSERLCRTLASPKGRWVAPASANWRGRPETGTSRKGMGSSQDCKATERVMAQCPSSHVTAI